MQIFPRQFQVFLPLQPLQQVAEAALVHLANGLHGATPDGFMRLLTVSALFDGVHQ